MEGGKKMNYIWDEFLIDFRSNPLIITGMIIMIIGFYALVIPLAIYRWRAISNKKAWDAKTTPTLIIAAIILFVGILMFGFSFLF